MQAGTDNTAALDALTFAVEQDVVPVRPARARGVLFAGLLSLIVLAPLPLGSARDWSAMALVALVGVAVACEAAAIALQDGRNSALWRGNIAIPAAFGVVLLWALAQAMLPVAEEFAHPIWLIAGAGLHHDLPGRISLTPYEGEGTVLRLLSYAGVFWLASRHCLSRERAALAVRVLACAGIAYAVYGLVAHLSGSNTILWFEKWAYRNALTSTFVNRNSYATYAGLGLLCAFVLLFERWLPVLKIKADSRTKLSFILGEGLGRSAPLLAGIAVLFAALLMTGSRGGALAALAGVTTFLGGCAAAGILRLRALAGSACVLLLLAVLLFASGGDFLAGRFEESLRSGADGRATIAEVTTDAIGAAPVLGYGLGSYPYVYRLHENSLNRMELKPTEAHDSYLENAAELGIPGAVLFFAALGLTIWRCTGGIFERKRDRLFPILGMAASVLVGVHALVDFSLQIPAIAVTYALILGAAYAQSFSSRERRHASSPMPAHRA